MMSMKLSDIAILNIKGSDYRCIISYISKNEAIDLMQKANITKHKQFIFVLKMVKEILTFGNIEIEKNKFYRQKTLIFLEDVGIEKVLVSKKSSFA